MGSLIYNVTTNVSPEIHREWLSWLKAEHIPEMMATGCFTKVVILHLKDVDETEGITYAVQYYMENQQFYNRYLQSFAGELRGKSRDQWGDKTISFRTIMDVVN